MVAIPFVSGLTDGNVIRYDITSSGYTAAKADSAPNSEVFGVIESIDTSTNKFNVVLYGSINISSSKLADMGSGGGSGGNDIYFLSGTTAGTLQNLAPTSIDNIIKPVYQAAPHGSYSGIVMNYLGYRIGGEVEAALEDTELGNLQIVLGNDTFTNGYVDAKYSYALPITDYPEFYAKYGTQYGYIEKIVVTTTPSGAITSGMQVTQIGSSYAGTVASVDFSNKIIYVAREPGTDLASTSKTLIIRTGSSTTVSFTISSNSIYSVYTPIVKLTQPLEVSGNNGTNVVTQVVNVGVKVKPQGIKVSIPNTITGSTITATTFLVGTGASNVESTLNNILTRLAVCESRLRI
jgi:hypothetical protein